MPGTGSTAALGNAWTANARTTHATAARAFDYERDNEHLVAGLEWQSLFGTMIPLTV